MAKRVKDKIELSLEEAKLLLEVLNRHWFSDCGGYNNEDVIDAALELKAKIKEVEKK